MYSELNLTGPNGTVAQSTVRGILLGPPELNSALRACSKRVCSWRVPPNWSARDWLEETEAFQAAAACQAERDYDPSRRVPFGAFAYQRMMARALTRYRQEWAYALRFVSEADADEASTAMAQAVPWKDEASIAAGLDHESLLVALARLSGPDHKLIRELFWEECTENEIARKQGVSQQAVSLRKLAILKNLRSWLDVSDHSLRKVGHLACKKDGGRNCNK